MRKERRPIVDNDIVNRIIFTMQKRGVRQKDLMENIGVASQVFSTWKYDNGTSYMNYIDQIADYLNVTPDYLLRGTIEQTEVEFTEEDKALVKNFHKLSKRQREIVSQIVILMEAS